MFELSTRLVTETFQELSAEFQTAHIYRNDVKHEESPHHLIDTALARFCCNSTMALESICIWNLHNISEVCIVVLPVFVGSYLFGHGWFVSGYKKSRRECKRNPPKILNTRTELDCFVRSWNMFFNSSTLHRSGRGSCLNFPVAERVERWKPELN